MKTKRGLDGYPANLLVDGRRVLVVGAGRIAARKIEGLLRAGAEVHVVAPDLCDAVRQLVDRGEITVDVRPFVEADLDGAWLAITATSDPLVNKAVAAGGEERHLFVNSADDPENCSYTLPAVVRRGSIVMTVSTGGRSPALAAWLKERVEDELGPEFETLLELLANAREEMRGDGQPTEDANWRGAIDSGMLELIRAGKLDEAKEKLRTCL